MPRVRRNRQDLQDAKRNRNGGTLQGATDIKNKGSLPKQKAIAETERKITKKN